MKRRNFVVAAAATSTLAGCLDQVDPNNDSQRTTERPAQNESTQTPVPAKVSWEEAWLTGEQYAVTVTIEMRGSDSVSITTLSGDQVTKITSSGTHKIAGEGTNYGTAKLGTSLSASAGSQLLGSHTVGSKEQPSLPAFLTGLSGKTFPNEQSEKTYSREFKQSAHGTQTTFTLDVPSNLYKYYKERLRTPEYGAYVADRYDRAYIQSITDALEDYGERNDLSARQIVDHAVAIVQGMKYTQDKPATGYNEYPKYPVETLVDRGGDCEDTCILMAAMLRQLGYGVVLLLMPEANHMAVGVAGEESIEGTYYEKDETRYYYLETTGEGWNVGEAPESVKDVPAELVQVQDYPVLVFSYAVTVDSEGGVNSEIEVGNVGTSTATNGAIQMEFHDKSGNVVASDRQTLPNLDPERSTTLNMSLMPPDDRPLRARVGVLLDGSTHDMHTSDYRSPSN
ncbi:transglutaminase-like domain-containing protein [Halolamina sediminis]|uniref:transglutaminase-like domain-containing protein n=1 Tax=Halolamina sediminis TaxID=1480675 RepID=UPI0006B51318|nr:transglutaminase-like domain-containing protein [Halolamina sediminis]